MSYARERTEDGRELIDFAYRVFKGEPMDMVMRKADGTEVKYQATPRLEHRIEMMIFLADRGFGKPTQKLEGEIRVPIAILHRTPPHDPLARASAAERVLEMPTERALPVASCPPGKGRGSR